MAKNLRKLRQAAGLTQGDLAKKAGLERSMITKAEKGERRLTLMEGIKLSRIFGVQPEDLIDSDPKSGLDPQLAKALAIFNSLPASKRKIWLATGEGMLSDKPPKPRGEN